MMIKSGRVAVLDVNHGGAVIAGSLRDMGYDAYAVDVYGAGMPADAGYDALVAPVHLPPSYTADARKMGIKIITHHEAVGLIVKEAGLAAGIKCIEITGTFGKTTTCEMLSRILQRAGEEVLLLTSRGLFFKGEPLGKRLSITPANIILALKAVKDNGEKPTVAIFEVSLGGCGIADIGAITTIKEEYRIAAGTSTSTRAKMQMAELAKPGSILVHEVSGMVETKVPAITFGEGGDVCLDGDDIYYRLRKLDGGFASGHFPAPLQEMLDRRSYARPLLCASAIALSLGILPLDIISSLSAFEGVEGRMKRGEIEGRLLLDNSSSGLSPAGLRMALEYHRGFPGKKVLVVGEESYNVCSGLRPEDVGGILDDYPLDAVIFVGERHGGVAGLSEGMERALKVTAPGDLIISCVKTWR